MTWKYLIPTRNDIPARFSKGAGTFEEMPELRLGVYCAAEAHKHDPWLIGSFAPSWAVSEVMGKAYWGFTRQYPTGDQVMFPVAGAVTQLIADGQRVPTNDQGHAVQTTDAHRQGHGRSILHCKTCGLRHAYRDETLQAPIKAFLRNDIREVDLATFHTAVNLSKANR